MFKMFKPKQILPNLSPQMQRMLVIVGSVFGLIFTVYLLKKVLFMVIMATYEPPAVTISSSVVSSQVWQTYITSVGTLTAVNGTDVSAEVSGIVGSIRFNSGQFVQQGDLLVELDSSVEQAQLKSDQAQLALAQINYDRSKALLKKNVTSQADYDTVSAKLQEARAAVEGTEARIKQKTITAPFAGKIGIRQINIGQYVSAGTTMVTLQSLNPLYVQFNLPEQYLSKLYINEAVTININNGSTSNVVKGIITAINSKVDQTTRNILVQATIPNENFQLYPGMFALVKVWLRAQDNVLTLPQTAISYSLHGDSVYIIKADEKSHKKHPPLHAYRQYVKVGGRRGDEVAIVDGVKAGDVVATSGQLKLQNGTHVVIDNSVEL